MTKEEIGLLNRFFNNQCSFSEKQEALELLKRSDALAYWQSLAQQEWEQPLAEDARMEKRLRLLKTDLNDRIREAGELPAQRGWLFSLAQSRVAAVWIGVLLLVSSLLYWQFYSGAERPSAIAYVEWVNGRGLPQPYQLPDSSTVYLAAGSKIRYPESFTGNTRTVHLTGEAFFDVKRNPAKPFLINTGNVQTKVLGTSFRVSSRTDGTVEVAVATGKVGVSRKGAALATLVPGKKLTWQESNQTAELGQVDISHLLLWKDGELFFDHQNMAGIARALKTRFGSDLLFMDEEVKTRFVSGTFSSDKTATEIMNILAVAGKFRFEQKNDSTYLIYKANR